MNRRDTLPRGAAAADARVLQTQWLGVLRQFEQEQWSACIARAANSAEVAANIHIRRRLARHKSWLTMPCVDALIAAANGLDGIFRRLIKPAAERRGARHDVIRLQRRIDSLAALRGAPADMSPQEGRARAKTALELSLAIMHALAPREASALVLPFQPWTAAHEKPGS